MTMLVSMGLVANRKKLSRGGLYATLTASLLLALMAWMMVSSAREDSVTFDEQPHLAAGYTNITRASLDFNVEHPPLIKDLAALPLLFMRLDTSWDTPDWFAGDPWEFGRKLLDLSHPDPDRVLFAVRAPIIALTLALGGALFAWTRRRYGDAAALLALWLYVFSPTILAHGRLVTTDLGASAGFFIATIAFVRFLERPSARNVWYAGAALGFALLTKFSTFLLVPIFVVLAVAWHFLQRGAVKAAVSRRRTSWGSPVRWTRGTLLIAFPRLAKINRRWRGAAARVTKRNALSGERPFGSPKLPAPPQAVTAPLEPPPAQGGDASPPKPLAQGVRTPRLTPARVAAVMLVAFGVVYLVYAHHLHNVPQARQLEKAKFSVSGRGVGKTPKDIVLWAAEQPLLRPWAAYFAGFIQVVIRSAEGNAPYLLGEFHATGVRQYFPLVYLMKEPAGLHVLTAIAICSSLLGLWFGRGMPLGWLGSAAKGLRRDFAPAAFLLVVVVYWMVSIRSNLNIGVRHMMAVLPFTFVLVARELRAMAVRLPVAMNLRENFILHTGLVLAGYLGFVAVMLGWQAASVLRVHPYYIAYFNEYAGGPEDGWQRVADSNADWGQDMLRLKRFVEERGIPMITHDYFGAADGKRYLPGRWEPWNSCMPRKKGWLAISVMSYQMSMQNPACDYRDWLPLSKVTTKVGYSTLIFHVE